MQETKLRQLVQARRWTTYPAFLAQFHRAARVVAERDFDPRLASLTISEKTFKRWLTGQVRTQPRPDVVRVLEALFDQPISVLFQGVRETAPGLPPGETNGPSAERQIHMAAQRALRFSTLVLSDELSSETIGTLHDEATRISLAYAVDPAPNLIADLLDLQDITFTLTEGRHRPDRSRELHFLAGVASGLMAKASLDLGNPRAALTQAKVALLCAERAGHHELAAKIISWQALTAYWAGWSRQAVDFARQGASLGTGGRVSIFLPAVEARAHAELGDRESAVTALAAAEEAAHRHETTDLDGLGGLFDFPHCRQAYFRAETHVLLDPASADAVRSADYAVAAMTAASPRDRYFANEASARAHQAVTRIATGDLDGAQEALAPVLELPAGCRNQDVVVSVMRAHRQLADAGRRTPGAGRSLQEQIEHFARTGPRSLGM
ncbi:hypothetical protein HRW18_10885 [Streptomyces lunaelactis]|nr:hypothetical protein [Streptomyces lunaelactis]NUK08505.1 hypothetical protein [Streptomyces lunaelactis]NUK34442.1 hypothetical protein [Streptomyces lunaelactis]NUK52280.1 hypothetical protein [Streptomyces lunaelactis]NUK66227.1 hypothetical protein [Streptomyces lunaelactis]NUK91964.1 hypothetical protein [Streptomyces lunaelactis]